MSQRRNKKEYHKKGGIGEFGTLNEAMAGYGHVPPSLSLWGKGAKMQQEKQQKMQQKGGTLYEAHGNRLRQCVLGELPRSSSGLLVHTNGDR